MQFHNFKYSLVVEVAHTCWSPSTVRIYSGCRPTAFRSERSSKTHCTASSVYDTYSYHRNHCDNYYRVWSCEDSRPVEFPRFECNSSIATCFSAVLPANLFSCFCSFFSVTSTFLSLNRFSPIFVRMQLIKRNERNSNHKTCKNNKKRQ